MHNLCTLLPDNRVRFIVVVIIVAIKHKNSNFPGRYDNPRINKKLVGGGEEEPH